MFLMKFYFKDTSVEISVRPHQSDSGCGKNENGVAIGRDDFSGEANRTSRNLLSGAVVLSFGVSFW